MTKPDIRIYDSLQSVAEAAADIFVERANNAIEHHGRFTVALSGGSTPKALHGVLAQRTAINPKLVDWSRVHVFFGDERHVPPNHPDSNYRMAKETLLSKVPIAETNVHRIKCENPDANEIAADYEKVLVSAFRLKDDQFPRFDLILLGMGPDGHTASLFPGTAGLREIKKRVIGNFVPKFNAWRVTFTFPAINHAECIMPMIAGQDKAPALQEVMGSGSAETYPIKNVHPSHGELIWILDRSASVGLSATQTAT